MNSIENSIKSDNFAHIIKIKHILHGNADNIIRNSTNKKKERDKVILFDYFTFDDFNPFERVDFFSVVVNFRC